MGLTFHDRINTQLIYRFELAQVVARRITKPQRTLFRFQSHWLLFFLHFFLFLFSGGGSDFIILVMSYFVFIFLFCIYFFAYISEFTVVCVVKDVLYMCLIHVKGIK